MKLLASLITGLSLVLPLAASAAPVKVLDFEAKTQLSSLWERPENRLLIETRMKMNHTNQHTGEFYETSYGHNVAEVQKYSDAYRCASGMQSACRTASN
jgi:hypothetical protein